MSERKLLAWRDAGLIDDAAVERILAWEDVNARPLALWAAIGIGALAIGLGIISVIAANWDAVPGMVRLALHVVLMLALGAFIALRADRLDAVHPWALEASLFVLAMLGMTFFGHVGQVYQTTSPLWQPLIAWLLLFSPILLLRGQSWPAAGLLFVPLVFAAWNYAYLFDDFGRDPATIPSWTIALFTSLPVLAASLGAWFRARADREELGTPLETMGLIYGVGGASLVVIVAGLDDFSNDTGFSIFTLDQQLVRLIVGALAGGLVYLFRRGRSGEASAAILAAAALACPLAYFLSDSQLMAALLFMALWGTIAAAALWAGWSNVFQLAVAVVALRLIILSFELASDLLLSGFGLILSGVLVLGIAWGALKIARTFAPARAPSASAGESR